MAFTATQLQQCKNHDPKSQRELYDLLKAKVMGICRRYTNRIEKAEDVFQETFIRVFQNITQVSDEKHIEQWVYRITVNTAIRYYHKNKNHSIIKDVNGHHFNDDEYQTILSQFTGEMLLNAINQLPEGYRMVFNLYEVEGYSHAEIGELLEISEATSR
jgi:RNA polymerase sigma-70 factor (ECF subfamily)